VRRLTSAQKAIGAAQELHKRAQNEEVIVIVKWGFKKWGLAGAKGITQIKTRGGFKPGKNAILKRLNDGNRQ
jgi:hypothetical protein